MKTYDLIKQLLTDHAELRDSDKRLIWRVWNELGFTDANDANFSIQLKDFMEAPSTETIRRCRQKIQELHPELQSSKWIKKQRDAIAEQKGTYIFRETVKEQLNLI